MPPTSRPLFKRELAILLGVLVPFFGLVVAAFTFTPAPEVSGPADTSITGRVTPDPPADASVRASVAPPADGGALATAAANETEAPIPPELEAPLKAVDPAVRDCFADQASRIHAQVKVQIAFRPRPDGSFDNVIVQAASWQDPYLTACLEDAFDEVHFTPNGRERFAPAHHTYLYAPTRR